MQQQEAVPPVSAEMAGQPLLSSEKLPDSEELAQLKAMNAQSSEGPRVRNQDKRTSRIQNRDSFIGAIEAKRETMAAAPAPSAPDEGVAARGIHVCVRKRPIFPHEDAAGDYDTTTVSGRRMAAAGHFRAAANDSCGSLCRHVHARRHVWTLGAPRSDG